MLMDYYSNLFELKQILIVLKIDFLNETAKLLKICHICSMSELFK